MIGSGLAGSVGIGQEASYGAYAVPSRFLEVTAAELKKDKKPVQGTGLAAGRVVDPGSRRVITAAWASGPLKMEVTNAGHGMVLAHALGDYTAPVQQGVTAAYTKTAALGDQFGHSLSTQVGVPDAGGVVHPYTYLGSKIVDAEWECAMDGLLLATYTLDAQQQVETEALAAPTYPDTSVPFHFGNQTIEVGPKGAEAAVQGVTKVMLKVARVLNTTRFYAGSQGLKAEPITKGPIKITGTIDADLITKADFADRYSSDTPFSLIWTLTGPQIATSGVNASISFALPECYLDGTSPVLNGPAEVKMPLPFVALLDTTADSPITVTYVSGDTAL